MKYFVGLDVSLQETAICIIDEDGIVIREGKTASRDPFRAERLPNLKSILSTMSLNAI